MDGDRYPKPSLLRTPIGPAVLGDQNEAISHFFRMADGDSVDQGVFLELARLAAAAGRHGDARRYYRAYLAHAERAAAPPAPFPGPGRA